MMTLRDLIGDLPIACDDAREDVAVTSIVEDSREADHGALFVARSGAVQDGRRFITDARERGAVAVLTDRIAEVPSEMVALRTKAQDVAAFGAILAERHAGSPSSALDVIGVTGTNGKTTTCMLLRSLLNTIGHRCGLMGTVELDDGVQRSPAALTTPAATTISTWLRRMVDNDCRACAMEVSSHALEQRRPAGVRFRVAVFTNLSGDHLDYHDTIDAYASAKARLFEQLDDDAVAVVNIDDAAASRMIERTAARIVTVSTRDDHPDADYRALVHEVTRHGLDLTVRIDGASHDLRLPMLGRHNVENALCALAACDAINMPRRAVLEALHAVPTPPGRLERITPVDAPFDVLVDYAHTDDALANVLTAIRPIVPPEGRLRVLFGCGGDRDRTKRPRMARVAASLADEIIITSDNPRTEDPARIIDDALAGLDAEGRRLTAHDVDRAAAIDHAVRTMRPGDVLLIAGKGHEDYQIIGTTKRPFDDRAVGRSALSRHHGAMTPC